MRNDGDDLNREYNLSFSQLLNTNLDEVEETCTKVNGNHDEIVWQCDHHCCLLDQVTMNLFKEISTIMDMILGQLMPSLLSILILEIFL